MKIYQTGNIVNNSQSRSVSFKRFPFAYYSEDSPTSDGSISDLEERLKPIQTRRHNGGSTVSTTTTLVREKSENSPR